MVDDAHDSIFESEQVGVSTDDFEYGLLDAESVAFADVGDLAQSPPTFRGHGVDVVGNQELHQFTSQGR
jgi:hypothetical protein